MMFGAQALRMNTGDGQISPLEQNIQQSDAAL